MKKSIVNTENYDFLIDVVDDKTKQALINYSENFFKSELNEDTVVISNFFKISFI